MKFKTFMKIVFAGILLGICGTCYGCYSLLNRSSGSNSKPPRVDATPIAVETVAAAGPVVTATSTTPLEKKILGKAGTQIAKDKLQDAFPGGPKVNLYQEDKAVGINRVKIDLDRDDKWDEKWNFTFNNGATQVQRQVSTADDDRNYDKEYTLTDTGWVDVNAKPATVEPPPPASGPGAMRSFDQQIVDKAGTAISGDKVKDAIPGSVKVNLYKDKGAPGVNRVKVDLDRDDKFDEKWTFEQEGGKWTVKRQVAPNDDESYTEEYRLQQGRWVGK